MGKAETRGMCIGASGAMSIESLQGSNVTGVDLITIRRSFDTELVTATL